MKSKPKTDAGGYPNTLNAKQRKTVFLDDKYIQETPQFIEAITPGIFKAQGVFETMLAVGDKIFDVEAHLKRLHGAFGKTNITPQIISAVVKANGFDASRVRVLAWKKGRQTHTAVMALKYVFQHKKSFRVCLIKTNRQADSRLANTKSLDYKIFANAYKSAHAQGFDEALLLNRKGFVFEASRANVFIFNEDKLMTPPLSSGCLNGITRMKVIHMARTLNIPVSEKNLTPVMIKLAPQKFLTNSLLGIMPFRF